MPDETPNPPIVNELKERLHALTARLTPEDEPALTYHPSIRLPEEPSQTHDSH